MVIVRPEARAQIYYDLLKVTQGVTGRALLANPIEDTRFFCYSYFYVPLFLEEGSD